MQAHSLVGCGQDAEQSEHDAAIPRRAHWPWRQLAVWKNGRPGTGGREDASEQGRHDTDEVEFRELVVAPYFNEPVALILIAGVEQDLNGLSCGGVGKEYAAAEKLKEMTKLRVFFAGPKVIIVAGRECVIQSVGAGTGLGVLVM